jgi:hypothetical protein
MNHSTLHPLGGSSDDRAMSSCPPFTATGIEQQVAAVIAPLALRYRGWPTTIITQILTRSWRRAFGGPLTEPGLSWCAQAIHTGSPWQHALWVGPHS